MRSTTAAVLILMASTGIATAKDRYAPTGPQASQEAKTAATDGLMACLTVAAAKIDDHVSDASTIVKALHGYCAGEFKIVDAIYSQGMSLAVMQGMEEQAESVHAQVMLNAVLYERRHAAQ